MEVSSRVLEASYVLVLAILRILLASRNFFLVLTLSATSFMALRQAFGRIVETDACRQALGVFRVPSGLSSRRFFLFLSDARVKSVIFNQI